ncbi:hypothetical protein BJX66DRAFT_334951 [Aspergillus keveii]|uniref:Uncharacterized protein n=1 Tax=Aspergillus keveii TaxID=714993 RepID=A0ABR4GFC6_9EURO
MTRPVRKRGRKPAAPQRQPAPVPDSDVDLDLDQDPIPGPGLSLGSETHRRLHSHVQLQGYTPSTRTVNRLIRIYRDTMYQCYFPFLPEKDLLTRWKDGISKSSTASTAEKKGQETSYMLLMALCAVASQTVSMNAVFDTTLVQGLSARDTDERFYFERAVEMVPKIITGSSTYEDENDHNTVSEY